MQPVNLTMRLQLINRPGTLARVLNQIAEAGGSLGAIEMVTATPTHVVRDIMLRMPGAEAVEALVGAIARLPGVQLLQVSDRVFMQHEGGKIEIKGRRPISNWEDLSLVYTPGVARVAEAIAVEPDLAYRYTVKGNAVAIVTDGSAVLGLGKLGPAAALPVMEGKALLFKSLAGIDAFPLCLNASSVDEIVTITAALSPVFGGINLEDIAAPKCFEVEERLRELLDIPVFHDDQHGTAIVTLAGLINALRVVRKRLQDCRIVISGAGAAGVAIVKMLKRAGAGDIIVCDRRGAISRVNPPEQPVKRWLAENTNREGRTGSLSEVLAGADIFIGVSGPGILKREDIQRMAQRPVVFALANPDPEVEPEEIADIAAVIATGRSDYPNQINNALAFPGVFRGALDCQARTINEEMCLAAAEALAAVVKDNELSADYIIPSVFNDQVVPTVSRAVFQAAVRTGVARKVK